MRLAVFDARRRPPPGRGAPRHRTSATERCGSARRPPRLRSSATPTSLRRVPLAGAGAPADRALPDPQPRHDRRIARPRRSRRPSCPPSPSRSTPSSKRRHRAAAATIPAAEFFTGTWSTALDDDEFLTGIGFPIWTGRCGFAVEEVARRHGDFAIAGACVARRARRRRHRAPLRDRPVRHGLDTGAGRPPPSSRSLGAPASDVDATALGRSAVDGLTSIPSDLNGSADYRRRVGATVVARAWARAIEEALRD